MEWEWDPARRERTLRERGIDFTDALHVFDGPTLESSRWPHPYGEPRVLAFGVLYGRGVHPTDPHPPPYDFGAGRQAEGAETICPSL